MYISARQLLLTAKIGDGCIYKDKNCNKKYPYLYVPRKTAIEIVNYYKEFMKNEPLLSCMAYKFGLPSQTIKSNKCNSLTGE